MRKSLTRDERLRRKKDIKRLFTAGKSVSGGAIRLIYRANGLENSRVLITLRKKFGTAVERNRARRLVKEAYRHLKDGIPNRYDIGFVLYEKGLTYTETVQLVLTLLKRAGLYEIERHS